MLSLNMLEIEYIERCCKRYRLQSFALLVILSGVTICTTFLISGLELGTPLLVSVVFSLVVEIADGLVWKKVASNNPEGLTTFYTAVSGFRMLIALFTLFICYLIVGREQMLRFCIVFMMFYFVFLVHHSVFFSHVSNSHSKCDYTKEK